MTSPYDNTCIPKRHNLDRGVVDNESAETRSKRTAAWRRYNDVWAKEAKAKALSEEDEASVKGDPQERLRTAHSLGDVIGMLDQYEKGGW